MRLSKLSLFVLFLVLLTCFSLEAQDRPAIERYVSAHQQDIVKELASLLSIPNVASDKVNIRKNAELLREMLTRRGFSGHHRHLCDAVRALSGPGLAWA